MGKGSQGDGVPVNRKGTPLAYRRKHWKIVCVRSNTITIRLRRPKAEIEAIAKPNVNAWINKLIDDALGPRKVNWKQHFERRSGRTFRITGNVERHER